MTHKATRHSAFRLLPSAFRVLTPAGRAYVLIALGLLAIGIHRSINLLTLLAYALLMMALLNGMAAKRSLRGLRVRRRIAEWPFARSPCSVDLHVTHPGRRPRWGLRLEDHGPSHEAAWFVAWLPGRGKGDEAAPVQTFRQNVILPRRGRYAWGSLTASSGYPFGLVERRAVVIPGEDVLILPGVGWLHRGRFLRHLRSLTVQPRVQFRVQPRAHPAAQAEFHGLRNYRGGDSPRLIHWRTSARRGELMVREFEDEPSDNLLVVLDPSLPHEWDGDGAVLREQFEEAISLTATICWEWCRRRGDRLGLATAIPEPVVVEGVTGPALARRVLECLALAECGTTPALSRLLGQLQTTALPSAIVVVVGLGRSGLADTLPHVLRRPVNVLDATRTERFDFYTPVEAGRTPSLGDGPENRTRERGAASRG